MIPHVGKASVADVVADVSGELPFPSESVDTIIARHVLEHLVDPVGAITSWSKVLKSNGKLILAVPNEDIGKTIPMNPEHVHVYTMDSLNNLMSLCGFRKIETIDTGNGISFVGVYKKIIGTEQKGESANG
jgi:predicted SAM-dependent methyltransferase